MLSLFYQRLICRRFIDFYFSVVLSTFVLSLFYRRGVVRRLVAAFYLCGGDLDRQNKFDQSKISNYDCLYVKELKL